METRPPSGIRASTDGSSTYVPALISFVGASSRGGFSTKAVTRPSSSVGTTPKADGSATGCRAIVPSAPRSRWKATRAVRSRSVSTSPLTTTKVSSIPAKVAAKRTAPAVSSGSGSTA